ncbi:MAG: hypothetical protein ACT4P7_00160 [Gemmatimonadaceae bacterium]
MRLCLDSFVANTFKAQNRLKRGGQDPHADLDDVADVLAAPDTRAADGWWA